MRMPKVKVSIIAASLVFTFLFAINLLSCAEKKNMSENVNESVEASNQESPITDELMVIETNLGTIEIEFYPDLAPNHVAAIQHLIREGFYDGTKFHRVIPSFMIQGGDPNSKSNDRSMHGMGGPDFNIAQEFSSRSHKRGIASMARSQHPDSAGSQFFIMVADVPQLDGQYSVWGNTVSGMDVVDKIVASQRDGNDNPIQPVIMEKVYLKAK